MTEQKKKAKVGKRDQKKSAHRDKLIDATISSIAQHGYAGTTVSTIQTMSGLSRGMINLHFSSKEALFQAALKRLANHYETFWRAALIKGGTKPTKQLYSVIESDLSDDVLKSNMLPVWFSFRAESHIHPEYKALYDTRDSEYSQMLNNICLTLSKKQGENESFANDTAIGIYAMIEGFWVEAFLHPDSFNKERSIRVIKTFIKGRFPNSL